MTFDLARYLVYSSWLEINLFNSFKVSFRSHIGNLYLRDVWLTKEKLSGAWIEFYIKITNAISHCDISIGFYDLEVQTDIYTKINK